MQIWSHVANMLCGVAVTISTRVFPCSKRSLGVALLAPLLLAPVAAAQPQAMRVTVDARDVARKLFHSEVEIPVRSGPVTLLYPRWPITTYRMPDSVIDNIVWLQMTAEGHRLEWKRDPVDMFAFHVVIPSGVQRLQVAMDVVAPGGRSDLNAVASNLAILHWYTAVLYPQGADVRELPVSARLILPTGWSGESSLKKIADADNRIEFGQVSLWQLLDSPVLAGKYISSFEVSSSSKQPVFVSVAAGSQEGASVPTDWRRRFERLVAEAGALFGDYPYSSYRFQIALGDELGNDGVEHRQSTDIRMSSGSFTSEAGRGSWGYLIPHEYTHAWNGLYRIPAGVLRRDYQEPQTTELLWVYEGLTRYLNWVLGARSGVLSQEEARDYVALLAAQVTHRSGREWRSLQDTAVSTGILNDAPDQWQSLRRGVDYYDESLFIWLEADAIIRRTTNGRRALDDFCRAFFSSKGLVDKSVPYTFKDITQTLNAIAPYDWGTLLRTRLDAVGPDRAPLDGLRASGWELSYGETPGSIQIARDKARHTVEERFSVGLLLSEDGNIIDVVRDSPAWKAGLGPDMKVVSVNGKPWGSQVIREAIASRSVQMTIRSGVSSWDTVVSVPSGNRYPKLTRNENADTLSELLKPLR